MNDKEIIELVKENLLLKYRIRLANEHADKVFNGSGDDYYRLKDILNCKTLDRKEEERWA